MKIVAQLMRATEKILCFSRNYYFWPDISTFGRFEGGLGADGTLNEKINPGYLLNFRCPLGFMSCWQSFNEYDAYPFIYKNEPKKFQRAQNIFQNPPRLEESCESLPVSNFESPMNRLRLDNERNGPPDRPDPYHKLVAN